MEDRIENLLSLSKQEFLNELFTLVDFEEWEREILNERVQDYEEDEGVIKLFDPQGYLLADIEVHTDGELELLNTFFDELREM